MIYPDLILNPDDMTNVGEGISYRSNNQTYRNDRSLMMSEIITCHYQHPPSTALHTPRSMMLIRVRHLAPRVRHLRASRDLPPCQRTIQILSLESPFSKIATVDYGYPITKTLMSNSSGSASSTTVKRRVRGPNVNKIKDSKNRVRGPNTDRTHKPTTTEMVDRRTTLGSLNPNTFNRSTINSTSQLTNICDKNLGDHSISGNYVMNGVFHNKDSQDISVRTSPHFISPSVNFTTPLRSAIIDSNNVGIGSFSVPSDRVKIQQTFIVSDDSDTGGFRDTVVNSKQEDAKQRQTVSMWEYYCYKVMIRTSEALTLHLAGRLWQQFIVDAFTAIEQ
ncbi:hypothetical protein POM88_009830 [Heracleum sosnowskyi]|uniref:Uncharacterized protein n=1 Tax=Heracleum sosnowskyi TaxID=360622 RepID=A0AAD8J919_9APIA|nr:hypothetical protein POM88_009830 [Heracleum sosnowskyi]